MAVDFLVHAWRAFKSNTSTHIVVCCAVLATIIVVRREFFDVTGGDPIGTWPPREVEEWQQYTSSGHRIGRAGGPLVVVVFSDFECPACRYFAREAYPRLREVYGADVSLVFHHWPLPNHANAYPAARAAECAAAQGAFEPFHDLLFEKQDSLGTRRFVEWAALAKVHDLGEFERCAADTARVATIERDVASMVALRARGTPTIMINGWYFPGGHSPAKLDSLARTFVTPRAN